MDQPFALLADMRQAADVAARFNVEVVADWVRLLAGVRRLLLTGEGSSRLFPAKGAVDAALRHRRHSLAVCTVGCRQAQDYDLSGAAVVCCSNSGKTAEAVHLFRHLQQQNHPHRLSVVNQPNSLLQDVSTSTIVLTAGQEGAVAATKSVVEQGLILTSLITGLTGGPSVAPALWPLAQAITLLQDLPIDAALIDRLATASTIYWVGREDGAAEELALKTMEIVRKPAVFLEGTFALHGVEEIMNPTDVMILVDPPTEWEARLQEIFVEQIGMLAIAIAHQPTRFPTVLTPQVDGLDRFARLAAGWRLLSLVGLRLGIDLDHPRRARKVGNEALA